MSNDSLPKKQVPAKKKHSELTAEEQERRREYWRQQRQRIKQDPEKREKRKRQHREYCERRWSKEEYLEYARKNRRAWYARQKQDPEKWAKHLRKSGEYNRAKRTKHIAQWCAKRYAKHKQRLIDDPVYAYYHREYLKASENERKGKSAIDPTQPR